MNEIQSKIDQPIATASAWILRLGVIVSGCIITLGLALSFIHHNAGLQRFEKQAFAPSPEAIVRGVLDVRGQEFIELGLCLLIVTPILRVAASCVLFLVVEHDRLYAVITLIVLLLTVVGLFWLK